MKVDPAECHATLSRIRAIVGGATSCPVNGVV